ESQTPISLRQLRSGFQRAHFWLAALACVMGFVLDLAWPWGFESRCAVSCMFEDAQVGKLLKAISFAAAKHRNQRRKNADASPYVNHPIHVAELLWEAGQVRDLNLIIA